MTNTSSAKNLGWSAAEYAALAGFDSDWRDRWWRQDYLALLATRIGFGVARRVLDVGCGAGHWGQRLATLLAPEAHVVGVDHEEGFLDAARARAAGRPQRFEYLAGRAEALPFADASFDLVTAQTVLIHVADARVALAEMARVCRPGGVVLAAEPDNLVNAFAARMASPAPPWDEVARLAAFDETCLRGKASLGQGDGRVGARLGALLGELGLDDVQVANNEQTAGLAPPYESSAQRQQIDMARDSVAREWCRFGDRPGARRQYEAGGGAAAAFDALFELDLAHQRRALAAVDAGTYVWGGAYAMYVASGRRAA